MIGWWRLSADEDNWNLTLTFGRGADGVTVAEGKVVAEGGKEWPLNGVTVMCGSHYRRPVADGIAMARRIVFDRHWTLVEAERSAKYKSAHGTIEARIDPYVRP